MYREDFSSKLKRNFIAMRAGRIGECLGCLYNVAVIFLPIITCKLDAKESYYLGV